MTNETKRLDIKEEAKVLKALNKLLKQSTDPISEEEATSKTEVAVMTPCNVCMVVATSEEGKRSLSRFIGKEDKEQTIPELDYLETGGVANKSKYPLTYLTKALKIFEATEEGVVIEMKNDYPITLTGEHYKIMIANRVDN